MAETLDCRGLECPQPVIKVALMANSLPEGTTLEIQADCSTFPDDIKKWCESNEKTLISLVEKDGINVATVQL